MKIFNILSHLLFFIGLFLKLFHIHYNAILMLIGLVGVVIAIIIGLFKKEEKVTLLLNFTAFGWLILIFVTVKFLPIQSVVLGIATLLTALSIILTIQIKKVRTLWPMIIPISIALFLFFQPTHVRYKILSINWNYEIEIDYITWDKYSWFLYQNGEFTKATEASEKANNIADQVGDQDWVEFIEKHKKSIKDRSWEKYR